MKLIAEWFPALILAPLFIGSLALTYLVSPLFIPTATLSGGGLISFLILEWKR